MCIKDKENTPPIPMTREEFKKYIEFIKEKEEAENRFSDLLSELGGGDGYAYLYGDYKAKLVRLLDDIWLSPDVDYRDIDYFTYEQEYGAKADEYYTSWTDDEGNEQTFKPHNVDELYDYLVKEYPKRFEEKFGGHSDEQH